MLRTLHLAEPYMADGDDKQNPDDVSQTQRLLRANRFGRFYHGPIDGVYGPHTAHAAENAKLHLGYRKAAAKTRTAGDALRAYLNGERKLPALYRARRRLRLKMWRRKSHLVAIHRPSIAYNALRRGFAHGTQTPVRIILHDTECHDAAGITELEGVVNYWCQTSQPDRLGSHFIVDGDGNVAMCGYPDEILYHVGGLNTGSVGIEQIGFASFTRAEWLARPHQLDKVARLLAYLHHAHGIPLQVPATPNPSSIGVLTHAMVSKFEPASEGHTDPGSGYPLEHVLAIAEGYVKAGGWTKASA